MQSSRPHLEQTVNVSARRKEVASAHGRRALKADRGQQNSDDDERRNMRHCVQRERGMSKRQR
jgi:hypothetical protein